MCRCPAHDDGSASLSVKEGVTTPNSRYPGLRKVIVNCFAGCSYASVLSAMGLRDEDLYIDPIPAEMKKGGRGSAKPYVPQAHCAPAEKKEKKPESMPQYYSYEKAFGKVGQIQKIYHYVDKDGKPTFDVVRIWKPANGDKKAKKTFRQCRRVYADREFPIYAATNDLPEEKRDVLYRLPQVLEAIKQGREILLVEGEKDVETLVDRGYDATTHAGGAKSATAPAWHPLHSEYLRGAEVLIIPDCDDIGKEHALYVAGALKGIARRVRVADLTSVWPEAPVKGDVSDMLGALGDEKWKTAMERLIKETPDFDATGKMSVADLAALYRTHVDGYEIFNNCLCQSTGDGPKRLANFSIIPYMQIVRDDGDDLTSEYLVDGFDRSGKPYPRCRLKGSEYQDQQMRWLQDKWGFGATVLPGNTVRSKVYYAMNEAAHYGAQRMTEYTHTGWRKLGGKWVYLYEGGAIGAEGVSVRLPRGLERYTLGGGADIKAREGAQVTWDMRHIMPKRVYIPLMGMIFLSPQREFLYNGGATPDVGLYLRGGTGAGKTVVTSLALSHFGDFRYNLPLPGSFHDTPKSQVAKGYYLKDMPFLIDDYHPSDEKDRRSMNTMAQLMLRAISGMGRSTLSSDQELKAVKTPRCLAIMTGEDLPDVGPSGVARMYVVNLRPASDDGRFPGDVPKTEALTKMQEKARKGYLVASMRGYIKWLARQADTLPDLLEEDYNRLRMHAMRNNPGQHDRMPGALAHIMLGYSSMLRYLRDADVITTEQMASEIQDAWRVLLDTGREQAAEMAEDKPTARFITIMSSLIGSGQLKMLDKNKEPRDGQRVGGYKNNDYYYLDPVICYNEVCRFCKQQDGAFPLGERQLYKQLVDEGIAEPGKDGSAKRGVNIRGRTQRLVWIARDLLDGDDATRDRQTGMQIVEEQGVFDT